MLPKINRLTQKEDFGQVLRLKKFVHGSFFAVATKRDEDLSSKVGIIVSNKISKKAVVRNKIKRIVRKAARETIEKNSTGLKLVVLTKPTAGAASRTELEKDIRQVFKRIE